MTLDPRISFYLNIAAGILTGLVGATAYYNALFDAHTTAEILACEGISLIIVNSILHAIPSKPGATNEFPLGPKTDKT